MYSSSISITLTTLDTDYHLIKRYNDRNNLFTMKNTTPHIVKEKCFEEPRMILLTVTIVAMTIKSIKRHRDSSSREMIAN